MTELLRRVVGAIDELTAKPIATLLAFVLTLGWIVAGPRMHYSNSWQLLMTTTSAVVTFLMVFVLASAQKRNTIALHLKIDMLVAAHPELTNKAIGVEHRGDLHVAEVRAELAQVLAQSEESSAPPKAEKIERTSEP